MTRVLVIDSEFGLRDSAVEVLGFDGHDALGASSLKEALELTRREPVDVLVIDLQTSRAGSVAMRDLRASAPGAAFILSLPFSGARAHQLVAELDAFDYVKRPARLSELRAVVERALVARSFGGGGVHEPETPGCFETHLKSVAMNDASVLLYAMPDVDRLGVARAIRAKGARARLPFIDVHCESIGALESAQLFGSDGAPGFIEEMGQGTLYFEDVEMLSLDEQLKLVRLLEDRRPAHEVDVRVIASTAQDLRHLIEIGLFRQDLFHRLAQHQLRVRASQPFSSRLDDLVRDLLRSIGEELSRPEISLSERALAQIRASKWAGGTDELHSLLTTAVSVHDDVELDVHHLQAVGLAETSG